MDTERATATCGQITSFTGRTFVYFCVFVASAVAAGMLGISVKNLQGACLLKARLTGPQELSYVPGGICTYIVNFEIASCVFAVIMTMVHCVNIRTRSLKRGSLLIVEALLAAASTLLALIAAALFTINFSGLCSALKKPEGWPTLTCKQVLDAQGLGEFTKHTVAQDASWAAFVGWFLLAVMLFWRRRNKDKIPADVVEGDEFDNPNMHAPGPSGGPYGTAKQAAPPPLNEPTFGEPQAAPSVPAPQAAVPTSDPFAGMRDSSQDNPFSNGGQDDPNNPFQ